MLRSFNFVPKPSGGFVLYPQHFSNFAVNAGRPPRDICLDAASEERRCICVNTGRDSSSTGYERICGTCRNPCLQKFTPDKVPKYVQSLAVIDDKDYDYNDLKKKGNRDDEYESDYVGDYTDDYYYDDKK